MCCNRVKRIWKDGVKYTQAVFTWITSGKPTRTATEIQERFDICRNCEHFEEIPRKPWRGRCGVCGCYLGRHVKKFIIGNKIAMRTEKCPEGKWE